MKTKESNSRRRTLCRAAGQLPATKRPDVPVCRRSAGEDAAVAEVESRAWMEAMMLVHRWETIFGKGAVQRVSSSWL